MGEIYFALHVGEILMIMIITSVKQVFHVDELLRAIETAVPFKYTKQGREYQDILDNLDAICPKCNFRYFEHVGTGRQFICPKKDRETEVSQQ